VLLRARRLAVLSTLALLAGACTLPGGGQSSQVLKIGVDLPLTGAEAAVAIPALDGVRLYAQQHPTLDGFTVNLVVKDDSSGGQAEPPTGAANVQSLASDPLVMAVIGPLDSSLARAEIPVANQASLAMVSPATSSPCLTRTDYLPGPLNTSLAPITCKDAGLPSAADLRASGVNNFFRLATTDDLQGPAAADFAYGTLHRLRMATISDGEGYGQALAAGFATRFRALGGSIVGHLDITPSGTAATGAFLNRVKADGAQAVYYGGLSANHGCAMRSQMAAVFGSGEAAPMLGGDAIAQDPACLRDAGANSAGIYATVPLVDANHVGTARPVIDQFKAAYPKPQDYGAFTVIAYDAAAVVYDAIHRAIQAAGGALPARGNVISQLSATQDFAGATGLFGFDHAGDTTRRILSVFESPATGTQPAWTWAGRVDYTAALPY
jgi:branched-chain amino acid transport system substrate-binding protein